jgi:hypothetical protein
VQASPPISAQKEYDFFQDVYIAVKTVRAYKLRTTGKLRPIIEACRILAERGGGLAWIGRHPGRTKISGKNHCYEVEILNGRRHFRRSENGRIFVQKLIQEAKTIETRYYEAVRFAESDPRVELAWENMVRDRLGLPRLPMPPLKQSAVVSGALVWNWTNTKLKK